MLLAPATASASSRSANTGPFSPLAAPGPVAHAVLRSLLGLPDDAVRTDVPERPATWNDLCGWYSFGPGVLTDPQPRMLGAASRSSSATATSPSADRSRSPRSAGDCACIPTPTTRTSSASSLPGFGSGTSQVVFSRDPAGDVTAMHLGVQPLSFRKRPGIQNPRPWVTGALAACALAIAVACRPRHERAGSD